MEEDLQQIQPEIYVDPEGTQKLTDVVNTMNNVVQATQSAEAGGSNQNVIDSKSYQVLTTLEHNKIGAQEAGQKKDNLFYLVD